MLHLYYGLIFISVVLFGAGFGIQDKYREKRGSNLKISMEMACIGSLAGLLLLLAINGFAFEYTHFTLLMAALSAINGIAFTFCTFRALDYINLSLFSLFAMLGGMALPFFQGILFYGEKFTLGKGICVILICMALACTVERGEKKSGTIFYIGVFILNGMSGVISKIFTSSALPKTSAIGYSVWVAIATVILSAGARIVLLHGKDNEPNGVFSKIAKDDRRVVWQAHGLAALYGIMNRVANLLLVLALTHVDASVQYPAVTGGTMIVSTVLCFFEKKKPSAREILSVVIAFLGMLALFIIPN